MDKKQRIKALSESVHSPIRTLGALEAMSDAELDGLEAHVTKKTAEVTAATQTKDTRIKALVASPHCEIKTLAALNALSEAELIALEAKVKTATDAAEATTRAAAAVPATVTDEQWLKTAPASVRSLVDRAAAQEDAQRGRLVASLVAAQKVYNEADLKAMSVEALTKLATLANIEGVDFSGQGFPTPQAQGNTGDVYTNPPDGYRIAIDKNQGKGDKKETTTTH